MSNQLTTFSNVYASSSPPPPTPVSSPLIPPTAPNPEFYSPCPAFAPKDLVGEVFDFAAEGAYFFPVAGLF